MNNKKWAVAISAFNSVKYSAVITSWELDENGFRINEEAKTLIGTSIEDILDKVTKNILD
jgi:hypothetical protein